MNMSNLVKYELPSVVVRSSLPLLGGCASLTNSGATTFRTDPVSPGGLVCPVGLEVDPGVAPLLAVTDLRVGPNSQLCSVGAVPASLFATSPSVEMLMDRIRPGSSFRISLVGTGPDAVTFRGRLLAQLSFDDRERLWVETNTRTASAWGRTSRGPLTSYTSPSPTRATSSRTSSAACTGRWPEKLWN
jgi:hypothetical protein